MDRTCSVGHGLVVNVQKTHALVSDWHFVRFSKSVQFSENAIFEKIVKICFYVFPQKIKIYQITILKLRQLKFINMQMYCD